MLYTEYDEEKVMNLFREEGREEGLEEGLKKGHDEGLEEGRKKGHDEGIIHSIMNMMGNLHWSIERCMDAMGVPADKYGTYRKLIAEQA